MGWKNFNIYLALLFTIVNGQDYPLERCAYMMQIPRPPTPDLPPIDGLEDTTWSQRPLHPAPEREDLCMDQYSASSASEGTQIILLEEEVEGDIDIAKLNYLGDQEPYITFNSGNRNLLGPELRKKEDGFWYLTITQKQDYESGMQQYWFSIRVDDEQLVAAVILLIVNIDDNAPIIHMLDSCQWPELEPPNLTECTYNVSDADGHISTGFTTFEVHSERGDDIFYAHQHDITEYSLLMTLGTNEALDYELSPLHIFTVTALDSLPNTHTVSIVVQVINVEHRAPRWVEVFAAQQFDEKTKQEFTLRAVDADTGINKPINYSLITAEEDDFFSIEYIEGGHSGCILHVEPIDRDELEREVFQLTVVAYKLDDEGNPDTYATPTNVVIIVDDVNDQYPRPLHEEYHIEIEEETPQTLNFGDDEFGFHDKDLGAHAQYSVHIESEYPVGAEAAFSIAPSVGYQRQTFIISTTNHSMLDYEVEEFQHIKLRVVATDLNRTDLVGVATVYIDLINWNDEVPIFENIAQEVFFNETEGAGFYVGNAIARDRDIGDWVVHSLLGNAGSYLAIDEATGDITVASDNSFDYHVQNQLYVQILAEDRLMEPYHSVTSQLVINLLDINNTPPTLRLPRGSPSVEENVESGYEISREIVATDPDTTADLVFEIDWDTSYATKQGREAATEEYHGCVEIETIFPEESNRGSAIGRVVVREIRDNVTIDFEEFEVLYLTVRVRDLNTIIGQDFDELTFTIIIIDMNDNPPVWIEGTLEQEFRVREVSDTDVIIGSVLATDIDGPLYNQVRYTIIPEEGTPEGLVKIDFYTGQINVDASRAIDADTPPREYLYYTVIASDKCVAEDPSDCPPDPTFWDTEGNISIYIIDTNNKFPQPETEQFDVIYIDDVASLVVYLYENATTGDPVVELVASDADRDEFYKTVSYQIDYGYNVRLRDFFAVDLSTGQLYVDYTTAETLDRDGDEPQHRIMMRFIDNFNSTGDGVRNQNETEFIVVLLDVNDNAPELPAPSQLTWEVYENLSAGIRLTPDIYAPDRDEPETDNSRVGYDIDNLELQDRDITVPQLFRMVNVENTYWNVTGELETVTDLRGYWGTYKIHIHAYDHGDPRMESFEWYDLVIMPYNFHAPEFVHPVTGTTVRLARERAVVNGPLATVSGEFLDRISATDEDGLHAGIVTFTVEGDNGAEEYIEVVNDGENLGSLVLKQLFEEETREFQVRLRATDGGTEPGPLYTETILHLVFIPTQGAPVFTTSATTVAFFEKDSNMDERHQLPLAQDPKNYMCEDDCFDIYYHIVDGNSDGHFGLDSANNVLYLEKPLDRAEAVTHTLMIAASNSPVPGSTLLSAILTVTVNVREENPRPRFLRELYTAGISTSDTINRVLLTVQAIHSEGLAVTYSIDQQSIQVDPSLEAVKDSAFVLHPTSGQLLLNIQPSASMHGMFEFQVLATDSAGAFDTSEIRIYLISSQNRVYFIFVNTLDDVEENQEFIANTLSVGFDMTCNIDQVVPASDSSGVALDTITEVRAHFIVDDVPVPVTVIDEMKSDTQRLRSIQNTLNTQLLVLQDFVTEPTIIMQEANRGAVYLLSGLSAILAVLCVILVLTYYFRTKALNRRLEALSTTKFTSMDSGLNRAGLAAPGTNKYATAGANPVYNEATRAPDFDAISSASDDSSLIGVEDLDQFRSSDYFPPADSSSLQGIFSRQPKDSLATHKNSFGFNPDKPKFSFDPQDNNRFN